MSAALSLVTLLTLTPGPVAVHYGKGAFGAVADRRHIAWQTWGPGVEVNNRYYDGFGASPLCDSYHIGGTLRADVYNRTAGRYDPVRLFQADVSAPQDRPAQLRGGRLLEMSHNIMYALGATVEQGWGRTPLRSLRVECSR